MRNAWTAWKAASRLLFWSTVEALTGALALRRAAAQELSALEPESPKALFDAGYACFALDLGWDLWCGYWRAKDEAPGQLSPENRFEVRDWSPVPWHRVKFKSLPHDLREFRAVPLAYARKHLGPIWWKVAA